MTKQRPTPHLLDELLPAAGVVPLPAEPLHLHLVDEVVGPEDVVILLRLLCSVLLRPVSLPGPRQAFMQRFKINIFSRRSEAYQSS